MSMRPTRPLRWAVAATAGLVAVGCGIAAPIALQSAPQRSESLSVANRRTVQTGETLIKVTYGSKAELQRLVDSGMDVWTVKDTYAAGTVPAGLLRKLEEAGTKLEMLTPRGYSLRSNFDKGYHTYQTLVPTLRAMAGAHPEICTLMDVGDTWEKKQGKADRDLWMLRITGKSRAEKPGIVFFGNHHARELVTVEVPLRLAQLLLDGYGKDPEITELVDSRDIYILPMVNPDGHIQAEAGKSWRKNTNGMKFADITSKEWGGTPGTDLNRNYGFQWGTGGSSSGPNDQTYMGKEPFSEPETQALRDFMLTRKNLKVMMSYHSFSNLILWPWGYSNSPAPGADKLSTVGRKLASWNGYEPKQASKLYVASGITDDWSYGQLGMLSFTTEIGSWDDNFDPPFAKVGKFWDENRPGALYLIKLAGDTQAAFGPEVRLEGNRVAFDGRKVTPDATMAEMFVGKLGASGTGKPLTLEGRGPVNLSNLDLPAKGRVWLRARDAKGNWGPATAVRL